MCGVNELTWWAPRPSQTMEVLRAGTGTCKNVYVSCMEQVALPLKVPLTTRVISMHESAPAQRVLRRQCPYGTFTACICTIKPRGRQAARPLRNDKMSSDTSQSWTHSLLTAHSGTCTFHAILKRRAWRAEA